MRCPCCDGTGYAEHGPGVTGDQISPAELHFERARHLAETNRLLAENDRLRVAETEARQSWRAESHDISEQAHSYRLRAEKAEAKLTEPQKSRGFAEPDRHDFKAPIGASGTNGVRCTRCGEPPSAYVHRPEPQRCPVDCQYRCHHTPSQEIFAQELSMAWDMIRDLRVQLAKVMTEGR